MWRVDDLAVLRTCSLIVALGLATIAVSTGVHGEDGSGTSTPVTVRKSKDGLNFTLPPDWPIETRGGITGPIPVEEYLAKKFNTLESRLKVLEQQFNGLDVRLRIIEEELKRQRQRSTATGPSP